MWPYSSRSSLVIGIPDTPKIHINLEDFAKNDKVLEATLTADIWAMVEWLSSKTDTSRNDVVVGLLFHALYGRIAYEQLRDHVKQSAAVDHNVADEGHDELPIKASPERGTAADLRYVGKSDVNRKLKVPHRMWFDLDRQASKANISLTTYVRGLLFKALQGEVNYTQWQYARTELEDRVKPPSRK
ncbi:MAG: hypothetical protein ACKOWD_01420 [Rhodoferax sp.]